VARSNRSYRLVSKRFIQASPFVAIIAMILGASISSFAFVRLQNGPAGLYWNGALVAPVQYTISTAKAAPGITDGSDAAAIRVAFMQWENVPSTAIRFQENTNPLTRARTDWAAFDLHTVFFDTDGSSNMFGSASGLVAVTPVNFSADGSILSADMIFNARDYRFSTSLDAGTFDIQAIATHEAGHFIGLDHTGVVGASLSPFAYQQDTRQRSLEKDDTAGVSTVYPRSGFALGSITGRLVRADNTGVQGAHVVAEDQNGSPASSTLTLADGSFTVSGLPAGSYVLYAEPLDGAVKSTNLSLATSHMTVQTDFATTWNGTAATPSQISVSAGRTTSVGTLTARPKISLLVSSVSTPTVLSGDRLSVTIFGSGFDGTKDSIAVSGEGLVVSAARFGSSSASFTLDVGTGLAASLRSIRVLRTGGDSRVLTGGIEVRAVGPAIQGISPSQGAAGTTVLVEGSGFQSGARVVFGGTIILNPSVGSTVTFPVPSGLAAGSYDIAVENPDGQFAKVKQVFTVLATQAQTTPTTGGTPTTPTPNNNTTTTNNNNSNTSPNAQQVVGGGSNTTSQPSAGVAAPAATGGGGGGGGCAIAIGSAAQKPGALAPFVLAALALLFVRRRAA
jgi:hypothetical protein